MLFVFWSSAQVKETNFLPAKEQLKTAIAQCRTEGDIQSTKSLTNIEKVSLEFDFAFGSDQARIILLEVLEFREFVRHGSKAGLIATGRHPKLECLVGPLGVVTISVRGLSSTSLVEEMKPLSRALQQRNGTLFSGLS